MRQLERGRSRREETVLPLGMNAITGGSQGKASSSMQSGRSAANASESNIVSTVSRSIVERGGGEHRHYDSLDDVRRKQPVGTVLNRRG